MTTRNYEAVFICGWCKKETSLSDATTEDLVTERIPGPPRLCSCGHTSYASSIRAKFPVDMSKWHFGYGSAK